MKKYFNLKNNILMDYFLKFLFLLFSPLLFLGTDCSAPLDYIVFKYEQPGCDLKKFESKSISMESGKKIRSTELEKNISCPGLKKYCLKTEEFNGCEVYVRSFTSDQSCILFIGFYGGITSDSSSDKFLKSHPEFKNAAHVVISELAEVNSEIKNTHPNEITIFKIHNRESFSEGLSRWCR